MWRYISATGLAASSLLSLVSAKANCDVDTVGKFLPANTNATLKSAVPVGENGTYGGGGFATDPDFPGNATNLPALCAVAFNVTGTDGKSHFTFGMYLPDTWNNRMMGAGNTGFGGGIDWTEMGPLVQYGFATISTDTGHLSGPNDAKWANAQPVAQTNWGYNAMHTSVVLGKQVINAYYGSNASYSYYSACSGGGRQGLKDLQLYPEDFDGVVAGAAPWLLTHLHPWAVQVALPNLLAEPADNVTDTHFDVFNNEVIRQCDAQDGRKDNVVSDPYNCKFDYTPLLCNSTFTNTSECFSQGQVNVMKATYADWVDSSNNNALIFPSFNLASDASGLASSSNNGTPSTFGTVYVENFVMNNTNWDWKTLNASTVTLADSLNPGHANADLFDLSAFKNRKGKLITYHGISDTLIPTSTSIKYYEEVLAAMGGDSPAQNKQASTAVLDDFYRMFLVPGMHHCSGSNGYSPWYFAGGGQGGPDNGSTYSVDGFMDPAHDIVLAIMAWVENGTAPASLVATSWHNNDAAQGVKQQRPLCPYPQQPKWVSGDVNKAESWTCANASMVGIGEIKIAPLGSADPTVVTPNDTTVAAPTKNAALRVGDEGGLGASAWGAAVFGMWWLI